MVIFQYLKDGNLPDNDTYARRPPSLVMRLLMVSCILRIQVSPETGELLFLKS